jgi:hypothetical protein
MEAASKESHKKCTDMNMQAAAAWEWWVREGVCKDGISRLEQTLGDGPGNGMGGGHNKFKVKKFLQKTSCAKACVASSRLRS